MEHAHIVLLLVAIIVLLATHLCLLVPSNVSETSTRVTSQYRLWYAPDAAEAESLKAVFDASRAMDTNTMKIKFEKAYNKLENEKENLQLENDALRRQMEQNHFDALETYATCYRDLYPEVGVVQLFKNVTETIAALRAELKSKTSAPVALQTYDEMQNSDKFATLMLNEAQKFYEQNQLSKAALKICREERALVHGASTIIVFEQMHNSLERDKYLTEEPSTLDNLDLMLTNYKTCQSQLKVCKQESDTMLVATKTLAGRAYTSLKNALKETQLKKFFDATVFEVWQVDEFEFAEEGETDEDEETITQGVLVVDEAHDMHEDLYGDDGDDVRVA